MMKLSKTKKLKLLRALKKEMKQMTVGRFVEGNLDCGMCWCLESVCSPEGLWGVTLADLGLKRPRNSGILWYTMEAEKGRALRLAAIDRAIKRLKLS